MLVAHPCHKHVEDRPVETGDTVYLMRVIFLVRIFEPIVILQK